MSHTTQYQINLTGEFTVRRPASTTTASTSTRTSGELSELLREQNAELNFTLKSVLNLLQNMKSEILQEMRNETSTNNISKTVESTSTTVETPTPETQFNRAEYEIIGEIQTEIPEQHNINTTMEQKATPAPLSRPTTASTIQTPPPPQYQSVPIGQFRPQTAPSGFTFPISEPITQIKTTEEETQQQEQASTTEVEQESKSEADETEAIIQNLVS